MINLTQTPLTNIILQNLVSLCSYLALAINIIGFIFTCIAVISVSLVFIHLSAPAVWLCVLVNGKWVLKLIIIGAVGDATNAGVQIYFSPASGGVGVVIIAQETIIQVIMIQETIIQVIMLQMTISPSVRSSNSGNNNPGIREIIISVIQRVTQEVN